MRTSLSIVSLAALAMTPGAAFAKPAKPLNAAMVGRDSGCFVRDANGAESFDAACSTFATVKLDAAGNIQHYIYHDEAQLQAGQAIPSSAVVTPVSYVVFGLSCTGTERITPTGSYSSNQVCTPL